MNRAVTQFGELFRSMSFGSRITSGLLLGVIVLSLVYLVNFQVTATDDFLLNGRPFSGTELVAVESAFAQAKLTAYELQGNRVRVPRGQRDAYIAALAEHNALPGHIFQHLIDVSGRSSLWTSSKEQEREWKLGKEQALSQVIHKMTGIETAMVQYDTQQNGTFPRTTQVTASVAVWPMPGYELSENQIESIRNVVAPAVAGLKPEDVTITDMQAGRTLSGGTVGTASSTHNIYSATKSRFERHWQEKIRSALQYIPGVVVSVNVMLEPNLRHEERSVKLDSKVVPIRTLDKTVSHVSTTQGNSDRPGVASQGANTAQTVISGSQSVRTQDDESESNVVGRPSEDHVAIVKALLVPNRVTVSVGLPSSYYAKVWSEQNPPVKGEEPTAPTEIDLKRIEEEARTNVEEMVVSLLPPEPPGQDVYTPTVRTFQTLSAQPVPGPAMTDVALSWLGNYWGTLGMTVLGLVSLVMLRGAVQIKQTPLAAGESSPTDDMPSLSVVSADDDEDTGEEGDQVSSLSRRQITGPNLREELAEMVREDPDAAANVIRTWIGNAE